MRSYIFKYSISKGLNNYLFFELLNYDKEQTNGHKPVTDIFINETVLWSDFSVFSED